MLDEKLRLPQSLPTIALRGLSVFPNVTIHFDVGREISVNAIEYAMETGMHVFLVAQKDVETEAPHLNDLHKIGTIASVRQLLRLPDNNIRVMVEGVCRGELVSLAQETPFLKTEVHEIPEMKSSRNAAKTEALVRSTFELVEQYLDLAPRTTDLLAKIFFEEDPGYIADFLAQNTPIRNIDKQEILEELRPVKRLERVHRLLAKEVEILSIELEIQSRTREQISDHQRDYYLKEQLHAIEQVLGDGGAEESETAQYLAKLKKANLPDEVSQKLQKEISRLGKQPFGSSEATVIRNYLDTCLELPWTIQTKQRASISAAKKILEKDHFGLEKVKERILEFIAVRQLAPTLKGQVLCLVGPPGVGKTSIAMSVAAALNRKFARISLGGIKDEAEIRGHRKTYIGAMPGRIISAISQAGTNNPLVLLDEIDKLGSDYHGDPAAALLEVLDTEQNSTFRDHYIELPFDISDVIFVTTANTTSTIPRALLDRMEVITLSSYTDEEKVQIAKRHLIPQEIARHGLDGKKVKLYDDALRELITSYTKEAGVRTLKKEIASLCRKAAMRIATEDVKVIHITKESLVELLGAPKFYPERGVLESRIGVVNGLAWTSVGGELLAVEVNVLHGTGKVQFTGNLGDVMKESVQAAHSFIRSRADKLGIAEDFYKKYDIHVHFPEGAVPKDGPSAGIAIVTAMVSALTNMPVKSGIAMTGEVSLRGQVLAIGGLREKTMAAYRNGIKTVIIPFDNQKDLEEIDQTVRAGIHFICVSHADEVLMHALQYPKGAQVTNKIASVPVSSKKKKIDTQIKQ